MSFVKHMWNKLTSRLCRKERITELCVLQTGVQLYWFMQNPKRCEYEDQAVHGERIGREAAVIAREPINVLLIDCTEHSPSWEADSRSASEEIPGQ
jgi:hypothetical protein